MFFAQLIELILWILFTKHQMVTLSIVYIFLQLGLTATTASPMAGYGRGHSFFLKMAMVAEF